MLVDHSPNIGGLVDPTPTPPLQAGAGSIDSVCFPIKRAEQKELYIIIPDAAYNSSFTPRPCLQGRGRGGVDSPTKRMRHTN